MIKSYSNKGTENIAQDDDTKAARKLLPPELHRAARKKLLVLDSAESLDGLAALRGNGFEKLKGDRAGSYSIRINDKYRICFDWKDGQAENVEIVDYHG